MRDLNRIKLGSLLLLSLLSAAKVQALPTDADQPMIITSDSVEINQETGVGIYRHNVQIDRGTTHVTGDKMTTFNDDDDKLREVVINGDNKKMAQYETIPEENKPVLEASAKIIKFYPQKHYVILLGNAQIQQGTDLITGEHLEYNMVTKNLISPSSKDPSGHKNRTKIVIEPDRILGKSSLAKSSEPSVSKTKTG